MDTPPLPQMIPDEQGLLALIRQVATRLLDDFERDGTFGQSLHLLPGRDERFTRRDWWIFFKRVPRLRLSLILGGLVNLFYPSKPRAGFGLTVNPKNPLSFPHASFFNDLLVWEILCESMEFLPRETAERIRMGARKTLDALRGNGERIERDGFSLEMYSYFPSVIRQVKKRNPFLLLIRLMDVAEPDNDSSSIVYSAAYRVSTRIAHEDVPGEKDWETLIRFLKEHVHGKGHYGHGTLSYENGSAIDDHGVLTWCFDEHNELDATSNVNVLGFLAVVFPWLCEEAKAAAAGIARGIFAFLARHAQKGDLMSPRFQQYYPLGAALFFWHRFSRLWGESPREAQKRLDPGNLYIKVGQHLVEWARKTLSEAPNSFNSGDLAWASPFLEENGILEAQQKPPTEAVVDYMLLHQPEVFHLLYPVRLVCAAKGLWRAAYLRGLAARFVKAGGMPDIAQRTHDLPTDLKQNR